MNALEKLRFRLNSPLPGILAIESDIRVPRVCVRVCVGGGERVRGRNVRREGEREGGRQRRVREWVREKKKKEGRIKVKGERKEEKKKEGKRRRERSEVV